MNFTNVKDAIDEATYWSNKTESTYLVALNIADNKLMVIPEKRKSDSDMIFVLEYIYPTKN